MKYFLDTEFIEGFHKPLFGKKRHFIDLISIGIVCEDGREYYAISNEFDPKDADPWVMENVISRLPTKNVNRDMHGGDSPRIIRLANLYKNNKTIANEILAFVYPHIFKIFASGENEFYQRTKCYGWSTEQPLFYGYYSDYDWVLFCSLFGRMIDLPKGFPMYCIDLKQILDEKVSKLTNSDFLSHFHVENPLTFEEKMELVKKKNVLYPIQEDEHNALADARWNKDLFEFIQTLNK